MGSRCCCWCCDHSVSQSKGKVRTFRSIEKVCAGKVVLDFTVLFFFRVSLHLSVSVLGRLVVATQPDHRGETLACLASVRGAVAGSMDSPLAATEGLV